MIRGLSHGKFTGVVLTKSIAESVFTARLLSALREKKIDIDETVKAMHKDKTKRTLPDKTSEATKFVQPLVDMVMQQMQLYLVTIDQTATAPSSGDNKEFQDMQQDNAKLRQKFQQAVPITPVTRRSTKRDAQPTASSPEEDADIEGHDQPLPVQTSAGKKRKTTNPGKGKADILNEPTDVLSDNLPSNINNTKAWVAAIRKDLSISEQKHFDSHVNKMLQVIEDKKFKKDELQTMATRWGLPFSMASTATPKNLQSIIVVATWHCL